MFKRCPAPVVAHWRNESDVGNEIPGMRGSRTHQLAVVIYLWHVDSGRGNCIRCGQTMPCASKTYALQVCAAAGEDPKRYEIENADTAVIYGVQLGNQHRRSEIESSTYQREL